MRLLLLAAVLCTWAGWVAPGRAGSFEIAPTTIELSGDQPGVVQVTNNGDDPVTVQVQPFDWSQDAAGDQLTPSRSLQVSPPFATIGPRQKQVIRMRVRGDGGVGETAHRLVISELPPTERQAGTGVRVLLRFSVPVFVASGATHPAELAWSARETADGLLVSVKNLASDRSKLSDLTIARPEGAPAPLAAMAYVLGGASQSWRLPRADWTGASLVIVRGRDVRTGEALDVPISLGRADE